MKVLLIPFNFIFISKDIYKITVKIDLQYHSFEFQMIRNVVNSKSKNAIISYISKHVNNDTITVMTQ